MSVIRKQVGDGLRARRIGLGLTGREAARKIGISPTYLTHIEQGRMVPAREVRIMIFDVLSVPYSDRVAWSKGWGLTEAERMVDAAMSWLGSSSGAETLRRFLYGGAPR